MVYSDSGLKLVKMKLVLVSVLALTLGLAAVAENVDNVKLTIAALEEAEQEYNQLVLNDTILGAQSKAFGTGRLPGSTKFSPYSEAMAKISSVNQRAMDILVNKHKMERTAAIALLARQMPAACQQPTTNCVNSKYRTFDGTCNNLNNPRWGSVNRPYNRVVPAAYDNGRDVPRGTNRLPNARLVSITVHPDSNEPNPSVTNMVPQFGQFLDHDITLTPEGGRQCCAGASDPDCFPIFIARNDPFYSRVSTPQTCMDFTRSTAFCFPTTNGIREQMNANTAFIDGSQIYSSNPNRAGSLRQFSAGRMKSNTQLTGFLPATQQVDSTQAQTVGQFIAGDDRINENPALTTLHNVFLMEHNRIATQMRNLRPAWSDEQIYQETRRIVGAELQQVTYDQYLPIVLGPATMQQYSLTLGNEYSIYEADRDPTIVNSFATAAYRFGHSLINGLMRLMRNRQQVGQYLVRDNFGQSTQFTQSNGQGYDWILGGLMMQNSQNFDPFVTADVTNFLFRVPGRDFGADLAARNIQRGRDHGLPGYNQYRALCSMSRITSMASPPPEVRPDAWQRVQSLYTSPDDIDLFTGGLIEFPVQGGLSGPTFNCIKALQFARLKRGDRFFFTHGNQVGTFTPTQVRQLRARTLGDIICENSQQTETTSNVFLIPSSSNPWVACNDPSRARLNIADFVV